MENKKLPLIDNELDIKTSKTSTSRFYFLLSFFGYFAFLIAVGYGLWCHRYDDSGKEVKVQSSTLYTPKYE